MLLSLYEISSTYPFNVFDVADESADVSESESPPHPTRATLIRVANVNRSITIPPENTVLFINNVIQVKIQTGIYIST